jgi:WD repeat and SOF domain-containing protein 1
MLLGSEDTNVRIWKMEASKTLAANPGRKERKEKLESALKRRYADMPEIQRIVRDKNVPKAIKKAAQLNHDQNVSKKRKQDNRSRHSAGGAGDEEAVPERKRIVIKELV